MRFYLDSAEPADIAAAADLPWVAGVTTNPSLLARAGLADAVPVIEAAARTGRRDWKVWLQPPEAPRADTLTTSRALAETLSGITGGGYTGPTLVIKLLPTPGTLEAAAELLRDGHEVCITAVASPTQALAVARLPRQARPGGEDRTLGPPASRTPMTPDSVAVYLGRLDDAGRDGVETVAAIAAALEAVDGRARVLVGSVRDRETLQRVTALVGRPGSSRLDVTLPLHLLRTVIEDPITEAARSEFA